MNDFLEELLELANRRMDASRSRAEKTNWSRLTKRLISLRSRIPNEDMLYRYALWAAWMMNNRSPFHTGTIRKTRRMRPKMAEKKRTLPKAIHARMILTNNPNAKEYTHWISTKPNIFERPI